MLDFTLFPVEECTAIYMYYGLLHLLNQLVDLVCCPYGFCYAYPVYRALCAHSFSLGNWVHDLRCYFVSQFQSFYLSVENTDLSCIDISEMMLLDSYNVYLMSRWLALSLDLRVKGRLVPTCYICGHLFSPPVFVLSVSIPLCL